MPIRAHHVSVAGDSGSGKTTLLREMASHNSPIGFEGVSLWLNHNQTKNVPKNGTQPVRSMSGLTSLVRSAMSYRDIRIDFRPSSLSEGAQTVKEFATSLPDDVPVQIVVDESHHFVGDDGTDATDNPIKWLLHEGRDRKIRVVVGTQDPQQWDYTPLKNAVHRVWVGQWAVEHKGYLNYFEFSHADLPAREFRYTVFDKRSKPLFKGETKAKFG